MAKNEIVKAGSFNLQTISGDIRDAVAEELDGLGALEFDRVKIPAGGGIAFELPGEDEDNPESSTALVGVILDHHAVNAFWKDKFGSGGVAPDCGSIDGKTGVDRETGVITECSACRYNQFGSDGGRGKACKNAHRIYILREGNPVPIILSLPPSSLKRFRDYIGKKILLKGLRTYQVITKITLKKEVNPDGITYSRAVFAYQDTLTEEQQAACDEMRQVVRSTRQQVEIVSDDYSGGTAPPANAAQGAVPLDPHGQQAAVAAGPDGFMDIPDNIEEELPFN